MIKRFLKIYPSIYFAKHTCLAPEIKESTTILKKDLVFNPVENKKIYLNNKLKKKNSVNEIKKVYYFQLWNALTHYNFTLFEKTIQQFLNEGYKYDEVIYTLLVHSYILNHKKKNENAYLVIEEMKQAYMHPTIIKINERMVNSFTELEMIFCEPSKNLWINICRFIWEISVTLNRERKRKLIEQLKLLHPNEVLKFTTEDLKILLKKEFEENLLNTVETVCVDSSIPYEHTLIEDKNKEKENGNEVEMLQNDSYFKQIDYGHDILSNENIEMKKEGNSIQLLSDDNDNLFDEKEEGLSEINREFILSAERKEERENINKDFLQPEIINTMSEEVNSIECHDKETFNELEDDDSFLSTEEDFDIQLLKKYFKYK